MADYRTCNGCIVINIQKIIIVMESDTNTP